MRRLLRACTTILLTAGLACPTLAEAPASPASAAHAPRGPVRCRQRAGVVLAGPRAAEGELHELALPARELRRLSLRPETHSVDPSRWPREPKTPREVTPTPLARALAQLCPPLFSSTELESIATHIVQASTRHDVDPMLLAALTYHQSGCDARRHSSWGSGLTMLNRGLFPSSVARGELTFAVRGPDGAWATHTLALDLPPDFSLHTPAHHLELAAALLHMYRVQCGELDHSCASVAHRHHVSHFVWGDHVRSTVAEDAILTARRRLIRSYEGRGDALTARLGGLVLSSPLEGAPRIVTSGLGEPREEGKRAHAGIDYASRYGEPVRAVADGEVSRAGADLADGTLIDVEPARTALVDERDMGVRGLFVEVAHEGGFRSIYAHLASYVVAPGSKLTRGDLIGYVGTTGIRESDPHLHFGLFAGEQVVDPVHALAPLLFAPTRGVPASSTSHPKPSRSARASGATRDRRAVR